MSADKTIRVMHLTSSRFFGGPERQMLGLANAIRDKVDTQFVSFSENGLCQNFLGEVRAAGFSGVALKNDTPKLFAAKREITNIISNESVQVLICHGYKAGIIGWYAGRNAKIPVIAVSRGWTAENWKVRLYEKLDRWILKKMNKVICVSKAQAERVVSAGVRRERTEVIHNSIASERFENSESLPRAKLLDYFPSEIQRNIRFVVGAAGRLSPEKGFEVLIEAAKQLHSNDTSIGFLLFGDGGLKKELQAKINSAGLQDHFQLAGFTDQLDKIMPNFDLFVQSSHTEGLPNVLLEALVAGTPIVATDVGGTSEVLSGGTYGKLIASNSSHCISNAISKVLTSPDQAQRMANNGQHWVKEHFTFKHQADSYYLALCHELKIAIQPPSETSSPNNAENS